MQIAETRASITGQARRFRTAKRRFRCRRSAFARSGVDVVADAALSRGNARVPWQAQRFRRAGVVAFPRVGRRLSGRRGAFARRAGAENEWQTSRQVQRFRETEG